MIHYWFYHIEHLIPAVKFLWVQKTGSCPRLEIPKEAAAWPCWRVVLVAQIFPRKESVVCVFSIAEIAGRDPRTIMIFFVWFKWQKRRFDRIWLTNNNWKLTNMLMSEYLPTSLKKCGVSKIGPFKIKPNVDTYTIDTYGLHTLWIVMDQIYLLAACAYLIASRLVYSLFVSIYRHFDQLIQMFLLLPLLYSKRWWNPIPLRWSFQVNVQRWNIHVFWRNGWKMMNLCQCTRIFLGFSHLNVCSFQFLCAVENGQIIHCRLDHMLVNSWQPWWSQ